MIQEPRALHAVHPDGALATTLPAPPEQCFLMWITTTPPTPDTPPIGLLTDPGRMAKISQLITQAVTNEFLSWLASHGKAHPTGHAWLNLQHLTPTHHPDNHQIHGFTLAIPRLTQKTN
ncbi:hypothetical protein [Allonocardiopsis opalescens]|uniref:Uncharacterized protein n=1 Tax=Allonocardiopsis opalescens TaxID=1144618 RepID=A0A2T0PV87_9ACTN|nr:hypothetical protein [Allonocardiopsis opalescens]PRX95443.1 hypothetical protein CLV72_10951 [Allonocardiopsis opalescens]